MGNKKCVYRDCDNGGHGPTARSFYRIHLKDSNRDLELWKELCGGVEFANTSVICDAHFPKRDFRNPNCKYQGLLPTAVPIRFGQSVTPDPNPPVTDDLPSGTKVVALPDVALPDMHTDTYDVMHLHGTLFVDCSAASPIKSEYPASSVDQHNHDCALNRVAYVEMTHRIAKLEEQIATLRRKLRITKQSEWKKKKLIQKLREELRDLKNDT